MAGGWSWSECADHLIRMAKRRPKESFDRHVLQRAAEYIILDRDKWDAEFELRTAKLVVLTVAELTVRAWLDGEDLGAHTMADLAQAVADLKKIETQ